MISQILGDAIVFLKHQSNIIAIVANVGNVLFCMREVNDYLKSIIPDTKILKNAEIF